MPNLTGVPCSNRGCPNIVPGGGLCPGCKKQYDKTYDAVIRDKRAKAFYNSKVWRELRAWKLGHDPLCELCKKKPGGGVIRRARVVDHIKPWAGDMKLALDRNNLQSLCDECNNIKSAKEKWHPGLK